MSLDNPVTATFMVFGIVAAFLIIFPLFWIFVVWLISHLSGWQKLAKRYPATLPPQGRHMGGQTLAIGYSRYRNTMEMVANPTGIWMQPMWLFRAGHKPVFIPWGEFNNPQPTTWRWQNLMHYDVGLPKVATIALPIPVLEKTESATSKIS